LLHLQTMSLSRLDLSNTGITDAGLAHLKGLPELSWLDLSKTQVTDNGLVHLKGLPLWDLELYRTKVTDAGLVHLKGMRLTDLSLSGTSVTDVGLRHLRGLENLCTVNLFGTKVSKKGIDELQQALPDIRIER